MTMTRTNLGQLRLPTLDPVVAAGRYLFPISPGTSTTTAGLSNNSLRLAPFWSPVPFTIDRLGAEITVVGEAGSKLRCGIYLDNGFAYPGALLVDAGQVAGDSATLQDLTVAQVVPAGLTWWGAVVQSAATTQPTVRTVNALIPPVPFMMATSAPTANTVISGYVQTGVTAGLPAQFTTTVGASGVVVPRLHCRVLSWA